MGHSHIQRLLGLGEVIKAGHDDDARLRVRFLLPDVPDQREPVHDRHAQIGQNDIRALPEIYLVGFLAVRSLVYLADVSYVPVQHIAHAVKGKQFVFYN